MTFANVLLLLQKVAAIEDGPQRCGSWLLSCKARSTVPGARRLRLGYDSRRASGFWTTPCRGKKEEPHTARTRVRHRTLGTGAGLDRNDAVPNLDASLLVYTPHWAPTSSTSMSPFPRGSPIC